jgi:glycosyltransferase involved in cell wall biosynthesis
VLHTIVHVLGSLEVGGGEQVALNLATGQVALGHRVHVVSLAEGAHGPHAANFRNAGAVVHRVTKRGPSVDPSLSLRLALLFSRLRANFVHTHNPLPLIYGAGAARFAGAVVVHTKHGRDQATRRQRLLRRFLGSSPHAIVGVSKQTAEEVVTQGECRKERVHVISNGIDLDRYGPSPECRANLRNQLGIPADAVVVGTVGRMSEIKNQPLLVRAMAPYLGPGLQLVIAGDGDHRSVVEGAVGELRNPQFVHLLGQRLDVPRVLPAFDIFALSSRSEGLPMVLPEAMACELPLVCTSVGGVPEVVGSDVGFLVAEGDAKAFGTQLQALAADPALRHQLGTRARAVALQRYSAQAMLGAYMALYEQLRQRAVC